MPDTVDEKLETGRVIWEMTQTAGWQILKSQIEAEIELELKDLIDCPIGEDMEHKMAIKAYKKVLSMVEIAENKKEEAVESLRKD